MPEINKNKFHKAGIPNDAIATTLPLLGYEDFRVRYVENYLKEEGAVVVIESPRYSSANSAEADLVAYVAAKEMMLSGLRPYCVSLAEIVGMVSGVPAYEDIRPDIWGCNLLTVTGFMQEGSSFVDPLHRQYISSILLKLARQGCRLILTSHVKATKFNEWWPSHFCGYIQKNSALVSIKGASA